MQPTPKWKKRPNNKNKTCKRDQSARTIKKTKTKLFYRWTLHLHLLLLPFLRLLLCCFSSLPAAFSSLYPSLHFSSHLPSQPPPKKKKTQKLTTSQPVAAGQPVRREPFAARPSLARHTLSPHFSSRGPTIASALRACSMVSRIFGPSEEREDAT